MVLFHLMWIGSIAWTGRPSLPFRFLAPFPPRPSPQPTPNLREPFLLIDDAEFWPSPEFRLTSYRQFCIDFRNGVPLQS
jgi:hypothetical protein